MTGLVIVAFLLIIVVACGLTWWFTWSRTWRTASRMSRDAASWAADSKRWWQVRCDELTTENASLRARNEFLVGLVGADVERAALNGSCTDEAGWAR